MIWVDISADQPISAEPTPLIVDADAGRRHEHCIGPIIII